MNFESWEALRGQRNAYELSDWISYTLSRRFRGGARLPSLETIRFLCLYNNIRREGNVAAHSATPSQIKEAVQTKPMDSSERRFLREMFIYAFKDIDV